MEFEHLQRGNDKYDKPRYPPASGPAPPLTDGAVTVAEFRDTREQFDAIYASQRLRLQFDGVLLVGY
jgi:hypothetical protein